MCTIDAVLKVLLEQAPCAHKTASNLWCFQDTTGSPQAPHASMLSGVCALLVPAPQAESSSSPP